MPMLTVWSDPLDPWAYVALLRLHRTRQQMGADILDFELRAWPAELVGDEPPPQHQMRGDVGALVQLESSAFSTYEGSTWPGSSVPAAEAQKWGFSLGQDVGEGFDLALRRAFFLHGRDVSRRADLLAVASTEGLDAPALAAALDDGRFRSAVSSDVAEGAELGVEGSPYVVVPDGSGHLNPGVQYRRVRGLAVLEQDHPSVYEELVRIATTDG